MRSGQPRWFSRVLILVVVLAVLIRLFYWIYTGRTWEDALISVLHSENAARGLGLTHVQPGPPLHGFTSPLSVLLPLVGDLVHIGFGLSFLKILSALCGGIAAWLGARICLNLGLPRALALTVAGYLAFEHHQIMWGMAGMETQVVTVAYLYSIDRLQRGTQWQKGLSLGFAMLARPDAAIWVGMACAVELWRAWKSRVCRRFVPVAAGLAVLYAPWLIFTFLYYGSPVPNTIMAKSMGIPGVAWQLHGKSILAQAQVLLDRFWTVFATLGPAYGGNGGGGFMPLWDGSTISRLVILVALPGLVAALWKRHFDALLVYAFVGAYAAYLTVGVNCIFLWYTAPVTAVAVIGGAYGARWTMEFFLAPPARARMAAELGVAYIAALALVLPETMHSDRCIQRYVESGEREQIGRYLGSVAKPSDTIGSESLGYVGYYSRRTVYDYPGLCSRKVVHFLREHHDERGLISMMYYLRPTFLVLRPREYLSADGRIEYPWIERDYEFLRVFRVPNEERREILYAESNIDFEFHVYRAKGLVPLSKDSAHQ
jgi:hypothetical protein